MIPKVSRGKDMGGLVRYLLDTDPTRTHNVHADPHLVAGSPEVMAWWGGLDVIPVEEARAIGRRLDEPWRLHGTDVKHGHVWHCSLSLAATEGQLPDDRWGEIAAAFIEGMGFTGGRNAPCRWAAFHHGLSAAGNPHVHVAVEVVREDGRLAWVRGSDFRRAQAVARRLEDQFGLVRIARDGVAQRGLSRAELERAARSGSEPGRWRLERTVRAVAAQAGTESQFVAGLRSAGVLARPHWAAGGREVNGYAVALRPRRGERAFWLGGRSLAADLSLPRLRMSHRVDWNVEAPEVAVAMWRRDRAVRRAEAQVAKVAKAGPVVGADAVLAGYAREFTRLTEALRSVSAGDAGTYGVVAHQLAGVLSAWSLAAEGARPGPLAAAARVIARSAQTRGPVAASAGAVPSLRGPSLAVASAAVGGRGPVGQAVLLRQLVGTARAVHDAHVAAGRAGEAARVAALADAEFAAVRDRLPSAALSAVVAEQARRAQVSRGVGPARGWRGSEASR